MFYIFKLLWSANVITLVHSVGEKAFEACKSYGQSMLECHNVLYPSTRLRVPIDSLQFPHMVLIGFQTDPSKKLAWKCGGTLISSKWVLTAAHCASDPDTGPASIMRVGTSTFEFDEFDELIQERPIEKVIKHPDYKPPSKYNDIALMKAFPDFILSRDIRIGCLQLNDSIVDSNFTAIGFGVTSSDARYGSQTLMKVELDIIDNAICNRSMKPLIKKKTLPHGIIEDQLCAGDYENGGRDTCQGDSGGPLQVMDERVDCINTFPLHTVIGVTSFGRDCGRKWAPGVYTRVSKYIDWIENIVWP